MAELWDLPALAPAGVSQQEREMVTLLAAARAVAVSSRLGSSGLQGSPWTTIDLGIRIFGRLRRGAGEKISPSQLGDCNSRVAADSSVSRKTAMSWLGSLTVLSALKPSARSLGCMRWCSAAFDLVRMSCSLATLAALIVTRPADRERERGPRLDKVCWCCAGWRRTAAGGWSRGAL
jgi:hypothetical protein